MLIVIPARYASTRFPGKPLMPILGKPLLQWTWEAARRVPGAEVVIATDSLTILEAAQGFGADVILTSNTCRNGTERVAEAIVNMPWHHGAEVVVNWQGDALLVDPAWVPVLLSWLREGVSMATPCVVCRKGAAGHVEVMVGAGGRALWFSRDVLEGWPLLAHVGMYAYRTTDLLRYPNWPESTVERQVGLEQLRWLVEDRRVRAVHFTGPVMPEVNYPEDVPVVEAILKQRGF